MGQRLSSLSTDHQAHSWRLKFTRSGCGYESAPCSVLVIGEEKTGKSTLVNNLLKHEDTEERSGQSSTHEAGGAWYTVELIDNPVAIDSGRGRNEVPLRFNGMPPRGEYDACFGALAYARVTPWGQHAGFPDLAREHSRLHYIPSIEHFVQKKKIDLVILCLKMPTTPAGPWAIPSNMQTSLQIVRQTKRAIIALTFANRWSADPEMNYHPSVRVATFDHDIERRKRIYHQWVSVNGNIRVFPTSNDPSQLLPNNKPWLSPLVLGIREMLSHKAVKYLKQHAAPSKLTK